jgi:ribosomal protein L35
MAYKYKPNKSVGKRFKVTGTINFDAAAGTGKLKRRHTLSTHLRSVRDGNKKRHLGRPAILNEGHARNMREMMGIKGKRPNQVRHERELAAAVAEKAVA